MIPLSPGLEADVVKLELRNSSYVLKIWNKDSRPDIGKQYELLADLYKKGLRVPKPYGWGIDADHNQVLLTSYDGEPISKLNRSILMNLAWMLKEVHNYRLGSTDAIQIPKYDFIRYFFPSIEMHNDINNLLIGIINMTELYQDYLIHGDYNLGNILEKQGNYTIIDWTNGQRGDPRYDIAWSVVLMKIYAGERYGGIYFSIFQELTDYSLDELKIFEAIACLRWILLSRIADLPKSPSAFKRVKKIIQNNRYLNDELL
ncbi:Phosphotransferase enzyme family protein [compost metagenome]